MFTKALAAAATAMKSSPRKMTKSSLSLLAGARGDNALSMKQSMIALEQEPNEVSKFQTSEIKIVKLTK